MMSIKRSLALLFWVIAALVGCGRLQVEIEPQLELTLGDQDTKPAGSPVANAETEPPGALSMTPVPRVSSGPSPSPTPVAPLPGLVYYTGTGLWWVTAAPVLVSERPDAILSPNGLYTMVLEGDDIWVTEVATGEQRNLTTGSGRISCCAQWWPARPDVIVFGSWAPGSDLGPTTGFLTVVNVDGSGYSVLDAETQSNALPGLSPDGQTIAYDRAGTSWLYRWGAGPEPLDPATYGLEHVVRIGGPSWSPDGRQLAWTVAIQNPDWQIAVAVFDLDTGSANLLHPYQNIGRGGWFPPSAWSPDGSRLAFFAEAADPGAYGLWLVTADGREERLLGRGAHPAWSPDGRWLAYNGVDIAASRQEWVPWLVEASSGYQIRLNLPTGAAVVDWLAVP